MIDIDDLQLRPEGVDGATMQNSVAPGDKLADALVDMQRGAMVRALDQTRHNKTKRRSCWG